MREDTANRIPEARKREGSFGKFKLMGWNMGKSIEVMSCVYQTWIPAHKNSLATHRTMTIHLAQCGVHLLPFICSQRKKHVVDTRPSGLSNVVEVYSLPMAADLIVPGQSSALENLPQRGDLPPFPRQATTQRLSVVICDVQNNVFHPALISFDIQAEAVFMIGQIRTENLSMEPNPQR